MSPKDLLLALVVVLAWGVNFVVIRIGLDGMPPMLLGAMRFVVVLFPAIFLVRRPAVPWRWLVAYGATISLAQFSLLFLAMHVGMPAGLASLVLQAQAFVTLGFAAAFLGERVRARNVGGLLLAASGLVLIGLQSGTTMTTAGFVLTLCAATAWALGNIVTKKIGPVDQLALVIWAGLIPPLPFLAMSWIFEGSTRIHEALAHITWPTILAVIYLALVSTIIGYTIWSWLLSRYPAGQVAPFSLMVPVVGLAAAAVALDERLSTPQVIGAVLVLSGLAVNVFGLGRLRRTGEAAARH
ncbi:MAG: EamA family transporter [Burkholderiaceae bacterium]